jgi:peroxiredoxin
LLIGCGKVKDAERVAKALKLPFPVLADPDRATYLRYDLGKFLIAIQRSGTFLIDKQGIVRYIHQVTNPQASVDHDELMRAVKNVPL